MENIKCIKCLGEDVGFYDHAIKTIHYGGWANYVDYKEVYTKYICRNKECNFEWKTPKKYKDLNLLTPKMKSRALLGYIMSFLFLAFLFGFLAVLFKLT